MLRDAARRSRFQPREEGGVSKASKTRRPKKARAARGAPVAVHRSADREARLRNFNIEQRAAAGGMLDFDELRSVVPRHRVWFYRNERAGKFPKRRQLGAGAVMLFAREALDYLMGAAQGPGTRPTATAAAPPAQTATA